MPRRKIGLILLATGVVGLALVAATYVRGYLAREAARAAWAAVEARQDVANLRQALDAGADIAAPVAGSPIGRLVIPAIALDEVVVEGVGDDALNAGPGHVPGVMPGAPGNAVVSAHRDRHFHRLDEIGVGDTVRTITRRHSTTWVITGRRIVPRHARAIKRAAQPTLTLTTCWPVRHFGPAPDRLILTATPVSGSASVAEASVASR